jgi:7-cyano-7-deazaguanine synthase
MKSAIVLLSGGLDSATTLYYAKAKGYQVHALLFDYGQRHKKELLCAVKIAKSAKCPYKIVKIELPWKGSALLDKKMKVPYHRRLDAKDIPPTYVPARNIIFLSFAASFAEALGARKIFIGANAVDYSGYPDCRPDFFAAYAKVLEKGLKTGVQGRKISVETPLIRLTKAEIVKLGRKLKVPQGLTWSCYTGLGWICGQCDSCRLRAKGFDEAGVDDPVVRRFLQVHGRNRMKARVKK